MCMCVCVCALVDLKKKCISGIFDVYVTDSGETRKVFTYENQGSFGELALMYNTPRATTIVARTLGSLWCLVRIRLYISESNNL